MTDRFDLVQEGDESVGAFSPTGVTTGIDFSGLYGAGATTQDAIAAIDGDQEGVGIRLTTDGTINDQAFLVAGADLADIHRRKWNARFRLKFALVDVADVRIRIGFFDVAIATFLGAADPAATEYAALEFDTGRSDLNFGFGVKDGTTQALEDSGLPVDTAIHTLDVALDNNDPNVRFRLRRPDLGLERKFQTRLLIPSEDAALNLAIGIEALTGAAKSLTFFQGKGGNNYQQIP